MRPFSCLPALALAALTVFSAAPASAAEGSFPDRPIVMVVPFTPGGPTDTLARTVAKGMQESLGKPVVIENRPGAGGNIGTTEVVKRPADGYTILFGSSGPLLINTTLYKNPGFNPLTDFTPIALVGEMPNVVVVNSALDVKTLDDFIAYAKKTENVTYGSSGSGSTNHISGFLLNKLVDDRMLHVPYKGTAPAVNDLLGGHITVMYLDVLTASPYVQSGRLRALGIAAPSRSKVLPDVPTFKEQNVASMDLGLAFGIVGPAGLPAPVTKKLNAAVEAALRSPEVVALMARQGVEVPKNGSPEAFGEYLREEVGRWREVVLMTGASVD